MKGVTVWEQNPLQRKEACLLPVPWVVPATNGYLWVSNPIRHYFGTFRHTCTGLWHCRARTQARITKERLRWPLLWFNTCIFDNLLLNFFLFINFQVGSVTRSATFGYTLGSGLLALGWNVWFTMIYPGIHVSVSFWGYRWNVILLTMGSLGMGSNPSKSHSRRVSPSYIKLIRTFVIWWFSRCV